MSPTDAPRYLIRPARRDDLALFPAIEESADILFQRHAPDLKQPDGFIPADSYLPLLEAGTVWVATSPDDRPVGFAAAGDLDGSFHIHEIDVHADHQRRGLGAALLGEALRHAVWAHYGVATLTTDRFLPWNKPFYLRHGFVELQPAAMPEALRAKLAEEAEAGFDPERRCAMAKVL